MKMSTLLHATVMLNEDGYTEIHVLIFALFKVNDQQFTHDSLQHVHLFSFTFLI